MTFKITFCLKVGVAFFKKIEADSLFIDIERQAVEYTGTQFLPAQKQENVNRRFFFRNTDKRTGVWQREKKIFALFEGTKPSVTHKGQAP